MRTLLISALVVFTACNGGKDTGSGNTTEDNDNDGVAATEDCNDNDATVSPKADELCNGVDDDCDGTVDNNPTDIQRFYADTDGDGYGDGTAATAACELPSGYVEDNTDCNDQDAAFHPGADESDCSDPRDYNCDGSTGFVDADADGYAACTECNDQEVSVNPGVSETCNDRDDDCDGSTDEEAIDQGTYHPDEDRDGYGDMNTTVVSCDKPSGYTTNSQDCADDDYDRNPSVAEICDANDVDENCNGYADDNDSRIDTSTQTTWYPDVDRDGYGDTSLGVTSCETPAGWFETGGDCDDSDNSINPSAQEICDVAGVDEDCDGLADDADLTVLSATKSDWYRDYDNDGYGNDSQKLTRCDGPAGYVAANGDCDDLTVTTNPAGTEVCDANNVDEDCDGLAEDEDPDLTDGDKDMFYLDADNDGYGISGRTTYACDVPSGYSAFSTDCNDGDTGISPGAAEICDASDIDENCNGSADDSDNSTTDRQWWWQDGDNDGYGMTVNGVYSCDNPGNYITTTGDCNDANNDVNPGELEICDAADVDEDCSGAADNNDAAALGKVLVYLDSDQDGYGVPSTISNRCEAGNGWALYSTDCNDANSAISPGAAELCAAGDEDCDTLDGDADPNVSDQADWFVDNDNDGYGQDSTVVTGCSQPSGAVMYGGDCNDSDTSYSPGVAEICGDGLDQDCSLEADDCGVIRNGALSTANARYLGASTGGTAGSAVALLDGVVLVGASSAGAVYHGAPTTGNVSLSGLATWTGTGIGASIADGGNALSAGTAYLIGSSSGQKVYVPSTSAAAGAITGSVTLSSSSSMGLGGAVAWADQGSDGQIFVGAPNYSSNAGAVFVLNRPASSSNVDSIAVATYSSSTSGDLTGTSVASVDFDGDGYDDLLQGAPGAIFGFGVVAGVSGPLSGAYTSSNADFTVVGANFGDGLGSRVANAGDVNGDGYDDLLVGALSVNRVYVMPGNRTGALSTGSAIATLQGTSGTSFGYALVGNADFNDDGNVDVAVGAPAESSNQGVVYLFAGPVSGSIAASSADGMLTGTGQAGYSLSASDVDGDGFDDLLVGSITATGGSPVSGVAYLLYGAE